MRNEPADENLPKYVNSLKKLKQFLEENPLVAGIVQSINYSITEEEAIRSEKSPQKAVAIGACLLKINRKNDE